MLMFQNIINFKIIFIVVRHSFIYILFHNNVCVTIVTSENEIIINLVKINLWKAMAVFYRSLSINATLWVIYEIIPTI